MSTKMPRENVYITEDIKDDIERYSKEQFISKSEFCRQVFNFYFGLHGTDGITAVYNFAEAKKVDPATVILACIRKQIPKQYWEENAG